jgi:hypothetical protein
MAWNKVANDTVALLSAEAGRHPYDRRLGPHRGAVHPKRRIRVRWAAPDVQIHSTGVQLIHQPVVSDLDLSLTFPLAGRSQSDAPHLHRRAWIALAVRPPRLLARRAPTADGFEPAASTDTSSQAESFGRTDTGNN